MKTLRPDVTVAFPRQDQHEDFQPLAEHWLARDRPVFAVLAPEDWQVLRTRGALAGLTLRVAAAGNRFPLIQVTRASESGGP